MKLKSIFKNTFYVVFASIITAGIFFAYFFTVGVPKTQARTYYNLAISELESGNKEKAKDDLQTALSYWAEPYIQEKLRIIN